MRMFLVRKDIQVLTFKLATHTQLGLAHTDDDYLVVEIHIYIYVSRKLSTLISFLL